MDLKDDCNSMFESGAWEANMGREQTRYFASQAIQRLPPVVKATLADRGTLLDFACALGDGAAAFKDAFPRCIVVGYEWAESGRRKAAAAYPAIPFTSAPPTGKYDAVYCSNLLEHMEDYREEMIRQVALASRFYIVLVPWEEGFPLVPSHVHSFNASNFPPEIPGARCIFKEAFPTEIYWGGQQLLAVFEIEGREP